MDLLMMALLLCELILGRVVGLAGALPCLPPSLLSSSAGWVQHVPVDPAQPWGTLHHSWVPGQAMT